MKKEKKKFTTKDNFCLHYYLLSVQTQIGLSYHHLVCLLRFLLSVFSISWIHVPYIQIFIPCSEYVKKFNTVKINLSFLVQIVMCVGSSNGLQFILTKYWAVRKY